MKQWQAIKWINHFAKGDWWTRTTTTRHGKVVEIVVENFKTRQAFSGKRLIAFLATKRPR